MSERKVLNKYYPPDFDVTKLPKLRLPKDRQFVIRIMAPMSMRCNTCGEYIYKGKKFNARQETVQNETYLGLRIYRFYIKCPTCVSEITFKTDPENTDYAMENGATRSFQASRLAERDAEKIKAQKEEEEKTNPMQALEKRTRDSRMEMEVLEKLEDIKDLNRRQKIIDHDTLLKIHAAQKRKMEEMNEAEDDRLVKDIFYSKKEEEPEANEDSTDNIMKVSMSHKSIVGKHAVIRQETCKKFGIIPKSKPAPLGKESNTNKSSLVQYGSSEEDD